MGKRTILAGMVVFFLFGLLGGVAWAHGHTQGSIYHGPYYEARSGNDYHHCWTEHSHGQKKAGCAKWQGNGFYHYCSTPLITQVHVHCTAYGFEGGGYGYSQTGNFVLCGNQQAEQSYPSYADGHGVCSHHRWHLN